jgi:hypothetical protein
MSASDNMPPPRLVAAPSATPRSRFSFQAVKEKVSRDPVVFAFLALTVAATV